MVLTSKVLNLKMGEVKNSARKLTEQEKVTYDY
jgi:hypothetical protein